jgi:uncharacterized protein
MRCLIFALLSGCCLSAYAMAADVSVAKRASSNFATARAQTTVNIKTSEFRGRLYSDKAVQQRAVGIVLIGGSEGELLAADAVAPQFAALGYRVLGVNYHGGFADRSRPLANVPLEQFSEAAQWLSKRTGIRKVVVIGESRGSEAALLTALRSPVVAGVIGVVPSIYVWSAVGSADPQGPSGWSAGGKPLVYVKPIQKESPDATTFTQALAADKEVEKATIPIEKIRVPILLLGSANDAVWPSGEMVAAAQERWRASNATAHLETKIYPDAGHRLLGVGSSSPTETYAWDGGSFTAKYGGTEVGNWRARADAWQTMLAFIERIERGRESKAPK